jgi:hypothetical protein
LKKNSDLKKEKRKTWMKKEKLKNANAIENEGT